MTDNYWDEIMEEDKDIDYATIGSGMQEQLFDADQADEERVAHVEEVVTTE